MRLTIFGEIHKSLNRFLGIADKAWWLYKPPGLLYNKSGGKNEKY
jgi:hypothetical protein